MDRPWGHVATSKGFKHCNYFEGWELLLSRKRVLRHGGLGNVCISRMRKLPRLEGTEPTYSVPTMAWNGAPSAPLFRATYECDPMATGDLTLYRAYPTISNSRLDRR